VRWKSIGVASRRSRPSRGTLLAHLRLRHGKQSSWFEETGTGADELESAHHWEHLTRPADHPATDLAAIAPERQATA
jgi:hypothetical protein